MEVLADAPELGADFERPVQHALRRHRIADHHRPAGAHDAGFLVADGLAVVAQQGHVVQRDAGDDRAVRVDDVHRVQPPAQSHLQDGHIQPAERQRAQDGECGELEIGQYHDAVITRSTVPEPRTLDLGERRQKGISSDRLAPDAATFLEMHQVGRGVDPGPVPGLAVDGLQHGAGRAFAVGAGHGDHRAGHGQAHALRHPLHPVQPKLDAADALGMLALAMGQPLV